MGEKMKTNTAYKIGFYDGFVEGVEKNPYNHIKNRCNFLLYLKGYDEGVSEYCNTIEEKK